MVFNSDGRTLNLSIDDNTYSESILYKCFYWYTGEYDVLISLLDSKYSVQLSKKDGTEFPDDIQSKIKRDLIDFKLRQIVADETKQIRELITAKAFAYYDVNINDVGILSDPIGFDPDKIV